MEKIRHLIPLVCLIGATTAEPALHEPFPEGYAMGNLGTIINSTAPGGCAPLYPAAFISDTLATGLTLAVTTYYDDMDNYRDRSLRTVSGGGWCTCGRFTLRLGISDFDALGVYSEQSGFLSFAATLFRGLRLSTEVTGTRLLLTTQRDEPRTLAAAGATLLIPLGKVSVSASVNSITVKHAGPEGADPSPCILLGLSTAEHVFGAQGVRIGIRPDYPHPVSLVIGQEFRFTRYFAIHGAVANNPLFIGIGCAVFPGNGHVSAAMVNHPVLGWSRGFGAGYGWNPSFLKKRSRK